MATKSPTSPAKNVEGDFGQFKDFARRILSVPHSKIKAQLDAEKEAKRKSKTSASRRPCLLLKRRLSHLTSDLFVGQPLSRYLR
jgi:hypothetical protein